MLCIFFRDVLSVFVLVDLSVRLHRKLFICIIKSIVGSKYPKNVSFNVENKVTGCAPRVVATAVTLTLELHEHQLKIKASLAKSVACCQPV